MNPETRWQVIIQLGLGLGLTGLFFYMMAPFMIAILLGAVIAILAYPSYRFFRKGLNENLSALCVTGLMALGILIPVVFIFYSATYKLLALVTRLRILKEGQTIESLASHPLIQKIISATGHFVPIDREFLKGQALDLLATIVEKTSGFIASFLSSMPGLLVATFIVILSTFFFLTDGARFLRFLSSLSPLKSDRSETLYETFEESCRGVVLGLFLSGLIQGILTAFLFLVTGLPDPAFIGFLTVIAGMIPLVGSAPIWIGATIYLFAQGQEKAAAVMLVGGLIVSTADSVVRPLVMKGHGQMHPFLALVSVFGAINLLGPTGIFLGPIIAAVFVSFLRILSVEMRLENLNQQKKT